jgi:hypothetical protein
MIGVRVVSGFAVLCCVMALTACGGNDAEDGMRDLVTPGTIMIKVTSPGSKTVAITYMTPDGDIKRERAAEVPWIKTWEKVESLPVNWKVTARRDHGRGWLRCATGHEIEDKLSPGQGMGARDLKSSVTCGWEWPD